MYGPMQLRIIPKPLDIFYIYMWFIIRAPVMRMQITNGLPGVPRVSDLWMIVGAAYGPRQQHCLHCLSEIKEETCIVACVSQTGRSGMCHSKGNVFRACDLLRCRWPFPQNCVAVRRAPVCVLSPLSSLSVLTRNIEPRPARAKRKC